MSHHLFLQFLRPDPRRRTRVLAALCVLLVLYLTRPIWLRWFGYRRLALSPCTAAPRDRVALDPRHDVTLVTMYVRLDDFKKGQWTQRNKAHYAQWIGAWRWINNTVIAYFDDESLMKTFLDIRAHLPAARTAAHLIERSALAAFAQLPRIREVFTQPGYPAHHPNTVRADYACAMNAKSDALEMAIRDHSVTTPYIAWIDLGYFGDLTDESTYPRMSHFRLEAPEGFSNDSVGANEVYTAPYILKRSPWEIIRDNHVWVAGGFWLAEPAVMSSWITTYRQALEELLSLNMTSTDQQVIAALYTRKLKTQPSVPVQTFSCPGMRIFCPGGAYTYFGYIAAEAAGQRCLKRPR